MKKDQLDSNDTATQILDVAERLVQVRGFNGFSYADIAAKLKITKAALHYHFASKSALGDALISRYTDRFAEALAEAEARTTDASARLDAYSGLYLAVLREKRMCLCGMMAAEYETLPISMQEAVVRFLDNNEIWLTRILKQGREIGTLEFAGSPRDTARMIVSGLEGAMLVARPFGDVSRFQASARCLLASLRPAAPKKLRPPRVSRAPA